MLKIEFLGCKRLGFTILAENQQLVLVFSDHTQVIHGLSRSVKHLAGEFDFYAPEVWRYLERKG